MLTRVILASYARTNNPFWHSQDVQICPYFPFAFLSTWPRIRAKLRRCVRRWFSLFQVCPSTEHAQAECLCLPFPAWDRNLFWCSSKAPSRIICLNSASHHVSEAAEIFSDGKTSKISKCLITFLLKIVWDQDSKIVWHLLWPLSTRSVMGEKFFGDFSPLVSLFGCMFVVCNVLFAAFWSWNLSVLLFQHCFAAGTCHLESEKLQPALAETLCGASV